jgi:hypothetical protein
MPARRTETPASESVKVFPTLESIAGTLGAVEEIYRDTDPTTGVVALGIIRWRRADGKKAFVQCRPEAGGFVMKAPEGKYPLYNRARIAKADTVVVVEGEKCVHALHGVGIVATTAPGGALKGDKADWTPLAGKNVILWPDNDAPEDAFPQGKGVAHMQQVRAILEQLTPAPRLYWLPPTVADLPVKGDAADLIARYGKEHSPKDIGTIIQAILDEAEPLGMSGELRQRIEETIAGKRRALPFGPWNSLSGLSRALMPGTVTCLCGDPGSTKSFLVLQAALLWHELKLKACIYELEEDRAYHMQRALAQVEGMSALIDPDWIEQNPEYAHAAVKKNTAFFDSFGRCIWEAPTDQVSLEMLEAWVKERAKAGFEVICIDPITAAEAEEKPWIADLQFLMSVKKTAREYGCRVVLVTHPKKGGKNGKSMDDMAGSAAYQRFSQTVLWIERHDTPKEAKVVPHRGVDTWAKINRTIHIRKARNGRGAGLKVGFHFEGETLRFTELGVILPQVKTVTDGASDETDE